MSSTNFSRSDWAGLVGWFALSHLGGVLYNTGKSTSSKWFKSRVKAPGYPPGWLFGVVWFIMYTLSAVSAFLIWQTDKRTALWHGSIASWLLMWFFNMLWSPVYFRLRSPQWALVVLFVTLLCTISTCILFFIQLWYAGTLLLPLIIWELYALYLNFWDVMYGKNSKIED